MSAEKHNNKGIVHQVQSNIEANISYEIKKLQITFNNIIRSYTNGQCCGSGSAGSVSFLWIRIRINSWVGSGSATQPMGQTVLVP